MPPAWSYEDAKYFHLGSLACQARPTLFRQRRGTLMLPYLFANCLNRIKVIYVKLPSTLYRVTREPLKRRKYTALYSDEHDEILGVGPMPSSNTISGICNLSQQPQKATTLVFKNNLLSLFLVLKIRPSATKAIELNV